MLFCSPRLLQKIFGFIMNQIRAVRVISNFFQELFPLVTEGLLKVHYRFNISQTATVLLSASFRICSKQPVTFISRSYKDLFSMSFISVQMLHRYCSIDTAAAWKKSRFILSAGSDFHMIKILSMAVHPFARRMLTYQLYGNLPPIS